MRQRTLAVNWQPTPIPLLHQIYKETFVFLLSTPSYSSTTTPSTAILVLRLENKVTATQSLL
jgi:hypothetical protein